MKKTDKKILSVSLIILLATSFYSCNFGKKKNSTKTELVTTVSTQNTTQDTVNFTEKTEITMTKKIENTQTSVSEPTSVSDAGSGTSVFSEASAETDVTSSAPTSNTKSDVTTAVTTSSATVTENIQTTIQTQPLPVFEDLKLTWVCASKEDTLPGDGQFATVTFKIKENTAPGEYNISLSSISGKNDGAVSKYDGTKKYTDFNGGIISVSTGYIADEYDYQGNEIYLNLTNAHGNPGETVTLYIDISNNYAGVIGAASLKLDYDTNALEFVSISQGSIFDSISKGIFVTNRDSF